VNNKQVKPWVAKANNRKELTETLAAVRNKHLQPSTNPHLRDLELKIRFCEQDDKCLKLVNDWLRDVMFASKCLTLPRNADQLLSIVAPKKQRKLVETLQQRLEQRGL
jgi:hypothetical protein